MSPARLRGVSFETPAMVDALVDEVWHHDEALPLLSFALEELWNARDVSRRVIPEEAQRKLGGAVAALARHGDTWSWRRCARRSARKRVAFFSCS